MHPQNIQNFTLVLSLQGRTDRGNSIVMAFRLRRDQVAMVRDLISTPQYFPFLALPTAGMVILVNTGRLIGIRLLGDLGALEMPGQDAARAIPISVSDFGKNAVEVNELNIDDPDPAMPEMIFYLAEKLDDHDQSELSVMDLEEEEIYQAAADLSTWEAGDPLLHILDDDGEDLWLNPSLIALASFKTASMDDLYWSLTASQDFPPNDSNDEDELP